MTIVQEIEFKDAKGDDVEVTFRGKADAVISAIVNGLPKETLLQLRDAMEVELSKRRGK